MKKIILVDIENDLLGEMFMDMEDRLSDDLWERYSDFEFDEKDEKKELKKIKKEWLKDVEAFESLSKKLGIRVDIKQIIKDGEEYFES